MPAFSRTGDPAIIEYQDTVIAAKIRDVGLYPSIP
jgi:hypothetical protein